MKNKILWFVTYIAIIVFFTSVMLLDSESSTPTWTCLLSEMWIVLFCVVNKDRLKLEIDE